MLTRRMQRHIKRVLVAAGVLSLLLVGMYQVFASPSASLLSLNEDDSFYQDFEVQDKEFSRSRANNLEPRRQILNSNRRRTFRTREGIVSVKDILFEPKEKLPKGVDVFKVKQLPAQNLIQSNEPMMSEVDRYNRDEVENLGIFKMSKEKWNNLRSDINLQQPIKNSNFSKTSLKNPFRHSYTNMNSKPPALKNIAPLKKYGPQGNSSSCVWAPCKEHLAYADLLHFKFCRKKSKIKSNSEPSASTCLFRRSTNILPLALASSPGSGADILRGVLQEVTGLCTGSIYCNTELRRAGYPGECLRSSTVLVVKTHQLDPVWSGITTNVSQVPRGFNKMEDVPVFKSAVFLIRDPYEAILEEWSNMKEIDHNPANFTTEKWEAFVSNRAIHWQQMISSWLLDNKNHPVLVVKYEDLELDIMDELSRILSFLDVPYSNSKLDGVKWKGKQSVEETAKSYSADQVMYINTIVRAAITALSANTPTKYINLTSYIL